MATTAESFRDPRDPTPPIVLPITGRGLRVTDRFCWAVLGVAMAVSAALTLYLNRGGTFFYDELVVFYSSPGLNLGDLIEPHNGHLVIVPRLVFKVALELFGADYTVFRILAAASVLLAAALMFALIKRRIGALPALAPAIVLLFFGSAWQHVVVPIGFGVIVGLAAGLGALIALERDDRRGDIAACALVITSIVTFSAGLAFLVAVAVSVLIRRDRWRRAWIFLIPLGLYAAWWLWSLSSTAGSDEQTTLTNVLLIPAFVADSLATVTAALTGFGYDFDGGLPPQLFIGWGRVLAAIAVVALAVRIRRGNVPPALWVGLALVLAYWSLDALAAGPERSPSSPRYIYPGAIVVLVAASAAASGIRFSRLGLAALFAALVLSLAGNLAILRDGAAAFRDGYSASLRAQFAMLDLARGHVDPDFDPLNAPPVSGLVDSPASTYFEAVDRYGSPGFSLAELERQGENIREGADQVLVDALGVRLTPARGELDPGDCDRVRTPSPGGGVTFQLGQGGATLQVRAGSPTAVEIGRFGTVPSVDVGRLTPGEPATLTLPPDASPRPWTVSVPGANAITVCPPL